jgi:hypothetical protein
MVRLNGMIMTDTKYQEMLQQEQERKLSLLQKVNEYFFGEPDICLHDFLWFYGGIGFCGAVALILWLLPKIWS